jgi:hypothetical protein
MTAAFSATHRTLRYRGEDTGFHVLAFVGGMTFFSRRVPRLYDAAARLIPSQEVRPGSYVNVRYSESQQRKFNCRP